MTQLTDAVAEYEAALLEEESAGRTWTAARDACEREILRVHPELEGGHFSFADDDVTDDGLYWTPAEMDWPGLAISHAPPAVQDAARIYRVGAALQGWRATTARWDVASDRLRKTPCTSTADLLEKFRALGIEDNHFIASKTYERVLAEIRKAVDDACDDTRCLTASFGAPNGAEAAAAN